MVTVFVKELDREVEVQDVDGCYFTEYGECYCFDAEEVAELYQKGKMYFDAQYKEFYMLVDEGTVFTTAVAKELN